MLGDEVDQLRFFEKKICNKLGALLTIEPQLVHRNRSLTWLRRSAIDDANVEDGESDGRLESRRLRPSHQSINLHPPFTSDHRSIMRPRPTLYQSCCVVFSNIPVIFNFL